MNKRNNWCVYVIRIQDCYKIGFTKNIDQRLVKFQIHSPFKIDLIISKLTNNPRRMERSLHHKFKDKKIRGEWFKLSLEDLQIIKNYSENDLKINMSLLSFKKTKNITIEQLEKIIKLRNKGLSPQEIGKLAGLSHTTVRKLLARYKKVGEIIN